MNNRLVFSKKLYLSESISEKNLEKIKDGLQRNPLFSSKVILVLSQNDHDQLEILTSKQLVQKFFLNHPLYVVGIASDYDAALEVLQEIVKECIALRKDCNLKEFLYVNIN